MTWENGPITDVVPYQSSLDFNSNNPLTKTKLYKKNNDKYLPTINRRRVLLSYHENLPARYRLSNEKRTPYTPAVSPYDTQFMYREWHLPKRV